MNFEYSKWDLLFNFCSVVFNDDAIKVGLAPFLIFLKLSVVIFYCIVSFFLRKKRKKQGRPL